MTWRVGAKTAAADEGDFGRARVQDDRFHRDEATGR